MKTGLILFALWLGVSFAHQVYAQETSDKIVENIRAVCLAPSEQGKYWEVEGAGQGKAKITIKLLGEVGGTGTVTLTQGEWQGVQQVLREKQADDNASYRHCVGQLTPLFLEKFVPRGSQRPQAGASKKSAASGKKDNNTASISQYARDHNTQIGNNFGNVVINPEKIAIPKEPSISSVHASPQALLVYVNNPLADDALILINEKDISTRLKAEFAGQGIAGQEMKVYTFEGTPEQLNLAVGKNKVVAKYGNIVLPVFNFTYTEILKTEAQRYFDTLQRIEELQKRQQR